MARLHSVSIGSANSTLGRTFVGKQFLLGRFHIINAIECKAKLFRFIFGIRYSHNVHWLPFLTALCANNCVSIEFLVEEGSNASDNCFAVSLKFGGMAKGSYLGQT